MRDATATVLLLPILVARAWPQGATLGDLLAVATVNISFLCAAARPPGRGGLFDTEP